MSNHIHVAAMACLVAASTAVAQGQQLRGTTGVADGSSLALRCAGRDERRSPVIADVLLAVAIADDQAARAQLLRLEPEIRNAALQSPGDVEAQYHFAALLGARSDREGGRTKIRVATEMDAQVQRVLDLAPGHAGASYLMGRLHAAFRRLDGVTRFLARRLLGAGALKGKTWPEIQEYFETAERLDPCEPEHHLELAVLHHELKRPGPAAAELGHVFELTSEAGGRWALIRKKAERLAAEWIRQAPG